jgi:hypothetical protein
MRSKFSLLILLAFVACKKDDTGDPDPQKPSLSVSDVTQAEGNVNNTMQFTVRLSQAG